MSGEEIVANNAELTSFIAPETLSANTLLERKADESYIVEWTELLQEHRTTLSKKETVSIVVFRLGKEWLGMSTVIFHEVAERRAVHKIPHLKSPTLMGLTNFRGQLRICIDMHKFLEISPTEHMSKKTSSVVYQRMVAIQQEEDFWIFPVDEVLGIHSFDLTMQTNVPVTVSKSTANYMKGVLPWKNIQVGLLDEGLLLYSLKRSLM